VVVGASIIWESALAVVKEMLGTDREAFVMGGVPAEFRKACSCALLAASSAAAADWASCLLLGEVEKNCAILLALAEVDLTKVLPPFSRGEKDGQGVGGELLKALDNRRGMARSDREEGK
jgi:hypothetical protein